MTGKYARGVVCPVCRSKLRFGGWHGRDLFCEPCGVSLDRQIVKYPHEWEDWVKRWRKKADFYERAIRIREAEREANNARD